MKFSFARVEPPPHISSQNWSSWTWQLQNSLKSLSQFEQYFELSAEEKSVFAKADGIFNIRSTPYYSSLARRTVGDPIRRILMPSLEELTPGRQAMRDPLGERKNNPAPRVIHRYPDRVLFLVTDICSVYCRYCTRKHFTGAEEAFIRPQDYEASLKYIAGKTGIREVILSGGDPLTISDNQLLRVLHDLRKIEHVEIIRIGTRMPVVCPMRISPELVREIRKYKPVYLMTHFNHPREITTEAAEKIELFVDHGVPVFNQMVLLNGVNNHPAHVQALSRRLLYLRAKPYYMFQCDPSEGSDHLRTSIADSREIQKDLWGVLSGLAMPNLSVDIPDGGGKAGIVPNFIVEENADRVRYQGWDGVAADYVNPTAPSLSKPLDVEDYLEEYQSLKNAKMDLRA